MQTTQRASRATRQHCPHLQTTQRASRATQQRCPHLQTTQRASRANPTCKLCSARHAQREGVAPHANYAARIAWRGREVFWEGGRNFVREGGIFGGREVFWEGAWFFGREGGILGVR
ncbi:MAG: hypothetical protein GY820_38150, partial [Gammaproteobacteria bacterium]|nr:hypothetical protein [Gammaproteobacteria bacterium]